MFWTKKVFWPKAEKEESRNTETETYFGRNRTETVSVCPLGCILIYLAEESICSLSLCLDGKLLSEYFQHLVGTWEEEEGGGRARGKEAIRIICQTILGTTFPFALGERNSMCVIQSILRRKNYTRVTLRICSLYEGGLV